MQLREKNDYIAVTVVVVDLNERDGGAAVQTVKIRCGIVESCQLLSDSHRPCTRACTYAEQYQKKHSFHLKQVRNFEGFTIITFSYFLLNKTSGNIAAVSGFFPA